MTTTVQPTRSESPPSPVAVSGGPARLIKAEMLKIWTTNLWWILAICALAATALALLSNTVQAHFEIDAARNPPPFDAGYPPGETPSPEQIERQRAAWLLQNDVGKVLVQSAANIFTSGQFFGLLIVMIIGTLLMTNEFYHQTATTTFLTTPRRTQVILAKLAAAVGIAAIAWLLTTMINLGVGLAFFAAEGEPNSLAEWSVQRAMFMNLPAYAIWAVFGVGLGVLLKNQLGATITGAGLYLIGSFLAQGVFILVYQFLIKEDWVIEAMVLVPGVASSVMISPEPLVLFFSFDAGTPILGPQWWVGALILLGYGVVAGLVGTLITRKRDIS